MTAVLLAIWATLRPLPVAPPTARVRYVTDANGVKVPIPKSGYRVVMGAPMMAEYLLTTNDVKSLDSVNKYNMGFARSSPLRRIYPSLLSKRTGLADAVTNPERLLGAATGTVVIPWGPATGAVRATGLPVVDLNTMRVEHWWFDNARIFGDIDRQPARGRQMSQHYWEAVANVQSSIRNAGVKTRPTVLEVSPGLDGTLRHTGTSGEQDEFETMAAGLNAIQNREMPGRLDMERLYVVDPDVLVLSRVAALTPAQVMAHPLWQTLKAVRNRRVYRRPPGMVFTTSGIVEYPLYTRWLAEILHPNELQPQLREIMRRSYEREIKYRMTDDDLDELLAVADNRVSAHHERFERQQHGR